MTVRADRPTAATTRAVRRGPTAQRNAWLAAVTVALMVAGVAAGAAALQRATPHRRATGAVPVQPPTPGVGAAELARYEWRTLPKAPIRPRGSAAAVWTGQVMIVWGGSSGDRVFADGATYDPARQRWTKLPSGPLSARTAPSATWVDGSFLVWGGNPGSADGARYDLAARRWSMLPQPSDRAPSGMSALVTSGHDAYLIRGPKGMHDRSVRIDRYSPGDDHWTSLPTLRTASGHFVNQVDALAIGGELLIWAAWSRTVGTGPGSTRTSYGTDAERFDLASRVWTRSPTQPAQGLTADGAQLLEGKVLLPQAGRWCGYCSGPAIPDVIGALIGPRTGRRVTVPPTPPGFGGEFRSTGSALLVLNPSAEVSGPNGTRPGDLAVWDPSTRKWSRLADAPRRFRDEVNVVWAGDRLLAWGGQQTPASASAGLEFAPR